MIWVELAIIFGPATLISLYFGTCWICETFPKSRKPQPCAPDIYSKDPELKSAAETIWEDMPELNPDRIEYHRLAGHTLMPPRKECTFPGEYFVEFMVSRCVECNKEYRV